MKKHIVLWCSIMMALLAVSCGPDEDNVFDESASLRMQERLAETRSVLTSSKYGWMMEFFPGGEDQYFGGYNMLCRYTPEGEVSLFSPYWKPIFDQGMTDHWLEVLDFYYEFDFPVYSETMTFKSHYSLKQSAGPVISFDTYSQAMHFFSDPDPSMTFNYGFYGSGMAGDYEFVVKEITENRIECYGKKSHNRMVMTRIVPGDEAALLAGVEAGYQSGEAYESVPVEEKMINFAWQNIYDALKANQETMSVDGFKLVEGDKTYTLRLHNHTFFTEEMVDGVLTERRIHMVPQTDGFSTYEAFTLDPNGTPNLQNFTYDAEAKRYVCTDEGVNAYMEPVDWEHVNEMVSWPKSTYAVIGGSTDFMEALTKADEVSNATLASFGASWKVYLLNLFWGPNPQFAQKMDSPFTFRAFAVDNKEDLEQVQYQIDSYFDINIRPVEGTDDQIDFAGDYVDRYNGLNGNDLTGIPLQMGVGTEVIQALITKAPLKVEVFEMVDDKPVAFKISSVADPTYFFAIKDVASFNTNDN